MQLTNMAPKAAGVLAAIVLAAAVPGSAIAQPPATASQGATCADFHKNADGSWTPNRALALRTERGTISVGPNTSLRPGTAFNGVDFASALDQNCQPR